MQEDTDIQAPTPLNDQVAKQLSDLGTGGALPGQTFTPGDNTAPATPSDDQVSETGETPSEPSVAEDADHEGFTPPAEEGNNQESSTAEGDVTTSVTEPEAEKPFDKKVVEPIVEPEPMTEPEPVTAPLSGDLEEVKKAALEELTPLVDKLELAPEKQYDLLMEIIESSNKQDLLSKAYDSAHGIADDEMRAQALVKIVQKIKEFEGK